MRERKFKPCLTKQLLNMFKLRCEWGLSLTFLRTTSGRCKYRRNENILSFNVIINWSHSGSFAHNERISDIFSDIVCVGWVR